MSRPIVAIVDDMLLPKAAQREMDAQNPPAPS